MKRTIIVLLTTLALVSCDNGNNGTSNGTDKPGEKPGNGTYAKELWGEWRRMDTGDKWYIADDSIKINGADASITATLNKQSERVVEVTDGGRKYYLYASRNANARFTGLIVGNAGTARAVGGAIGGVRVAIANLNNKADELSVVTNTEGVFTAEEIIPGDAYTVTPEGGTPATVIPANDGADVGVVTVTSGVNFKTSISPAQSSTDISELYINENYALNLEFENVGDEDCPAPSYTISAADDLIVTGKLQGILGTIEPGVKKSVPINVECFEVADDYEYKKINVTITDGTGKTWEDSVSLRFYKETIDFNIRAERPISGIVITPDAKTYSFTNVTNETVAVPRRSTGDYLVVFSGATIETETRYALGIGVEADEDFGTFFDTSIYEPNNTEGQVVTVGEQRLMAYLYKNDIDYYRVSYGKVHFPSAPTNINARVMDARVTVSWDAASDANSYNVYRSGSQTGAYTKVGESASPSYIDTVDDVGTYYYKVSAVSADGLESAYSASMSAIVIAPPMPTNVTADVVDAKVTVSWSAVLGANSYNVYRSGSRAGTYDKIGESASLSYIDTVGGVGTYYRVSAVSADGFESAYSTPTSAIVTIEIEVADLTDTLSEIAANAVDSTHYTLLLGRDETISAQTLLYSGKTVMITLKGSGGERTVNLSGYRSLFTVGYGVTLVLDGGVTLKGHSSSNASLVRVYSGGTLLLKDGAKISGNTAANSFISGGGVFVDSNGTFEMSGGTISGNTASSSNATSNGGGVYVSSSGRFEMSGGTISGNIASSSTSYSVGGGVYVSGTFEMSGGTISGNTASSSTSIYYASSNGGGVSVSNSGTFEMSGGTISGNTASTISSYSHSNGGGVSVSGTFEMSGGTISGNTATTSSTSTSFSAYSQGGGVYVYSNGWFTKQSGGTIYGSNASDSLKNTATGGDYGHAVYVYSGSKKRDTTAGVGVTLDSRVSGSAGGWE